MPCLSTSEEKELQRIWGVNQKMGSEQERKFCGLQRRSGSY